MNRREFIYRSVAVVVGFPAVAKAAPSFGRRLSVLPDDPGYSPEALFCSVTLNGVKLPYCVTADEVLGEALCYRVGANGALWVDERADRLEMVLHRGVVRITGPVYL